jgi:hypothetical protein
MTEKVSMVREENVEMSCSCGALFLGSMDQVERLLRRHPCTGRSHVLVALLFLILVFIAFLVIWSTWPPG